MLTTNLGYPDREKPRASSGLHDRSFVVVPGAVVRSSHSRVKLTREQVEELRTALAVDCPRMAWSDAEVTEAVENLITALLFLATQPGRSFRGMEEHGRQRAE